VGDHVLTLDIYCRISVDYDGTLRSVESQEEDCREAIDDNPAWVVGKVFRDHAKSAWNPKVHRPEFEEMMTRLEEGHIDGLIVYDLSRFTRKPAEGERLLALAKRGVVVASITTTYNLLTADGRKAFRDKMTANAHESDLISERSTRGKKKKARRGKSNASWRGFARPGWMPVDEDWETGDLRTPVPAEQLDREVAAVRDAADRLLAGETLAQLAREWNNAELWTVTGNKWDGALIRQMLEAPSLAGLAEYKGEVLGELPGDPVLDRDTWERLTLHFTSRKRGRPAITYLLSGVIRCGKCGSPMYGRPLVARPPYANGDTRRQYWCQVREKQGGCGKLCIDWLLADGIVAKAVIRKLGDPRHADRVARETAQVTEVRSRLQVEVTRLEGDAEALATKVATWGMARVDKAMEPIDARLADLRRQLAGLEVPESPGASAKGAQEDWMGATLTQRRAMVRRAFPDGITILPANSRGVGSRTDEARVHFERRKGDRSGNHAEDRQIVA